MRLESSNDMGDPREISCSSGTMELRGQRDREGPSWHTQHFYPIIKTKLCSLNIIFCSPSDHLCCHGSYQVPEVPQETCVES